MSGAVNKILKTEPCGVDNQVEDDDELPVMGGMRIIHTPGHTPGSICIYVRHRSLIFVGDLVARLRALKLPSMPFTADIPLELQSIRKLAGLEFETMCFGHGHPVRQGASQMVADFAHRLEEKR